MTNQLRSSPHEHERGGNLYPFERKELYWGMICIIPIVCLISYLSTTRIFFNWGTETDYLGGFVGEAQRILDGKPLDMNFHPPFYSLTIALVELLTRDWLVTGLILSWVSSVVVLIESFIIFFHIGGRPAAWGSVIALGTSPTYISYSSQATSDVFFLVFYSSCFLFIILAIARRANPVWFLAGTSLGLALLTRSNGITLSMLFFSPWTGHSVLTARIKYAAYLLAGVLMPIMLWGGFAKLTGSPIFPQKNHINLALTYFTEGKDRISGDSRRQIEDKFENVKDVLTKDPLHIAKTYMKDLYRLPEKIISSHLVALPVLLFAIPGVGFLFFSRRNYIYLLIFAATFLQICLVNFKAYETRYFLFLVPLLGAGAGVCLNRLFDAIDSVRFRLTVVLAVSFVLMIGSVKSLKNVYSDLHASDTELAETIPQVNKSVPIGGRIVSRKPHIGFYSSKENVSFPLVENLDHLQKSLEEANQRSPIYLYYGGPEKSHRPQFKDLSFPERAPAWLIPVAKSQTPGVWALYRFRSSTATKIYD